MERTRLKLHNASYQRSYSLENAYKRGWEDADASHWREPSEEPDQPCPCLIILKGETHATLVDFDGAFFVGDDTIYSPDEVQTWMKVPNVSKS